MSDKDRIYDIWRSYRSVLKWVPKIIHFRLYTIGCSSKTVHLGVPLFQETCIFGCTEEITSKYLWSGNYKLDNYAWCNRMSFAFCWLAWYDPLRDFSQWGYNWIFKHEEGIPWALGRDVATVENREIPWGQLTYGLETHGRERNVSYKWRVFHIYIYLYKGNGGTV